LALKDSVFNFGFFEKFFGCFFGHFSGRDSVTVDPLLLVDQTTVDLFALFAILEAFLQRFEQCLSLFTIHASLHCRIEYNVIE
jgi:hypothetical protein